MGSKASKLHEEALKCHESKNYEEALKLHDESIKLDPNNIEFLNSKGIALEYCNKYKEAKLCYQESLTINKRNPNAYLGLGNIYYNNGNYEDALYNFNEAIKLDDKNIVALNNRGTVFQALERYEEALRSFNDALRIDKNYFLANYGLGYVYYLKGLKERSNVEFAQLFFHQALKYLSLSDEKKISQSVTFYKGMALKHLNRLDEAEKEFNKAINIKADYYEAYIEKFNIMKIKNLFSEILEEIKNKNLSKNKEIYDYKLKIESLMSEQSIQCSNYSTLK